MWKYFYIQYVMASDLWAIIGKDLPYSRVKVYVSIVKIEIFYALFT